MSRPPVDHRKLTDDTARAKKGEDTLVAGTRNHCDLEKPVLNAVAAVASVASLEQHLVCGKPHRSSGCKQVCRKMVRQLRKQALRAMQRNLRLTQLRECLVAQAG
jgi:hypothetical protein